MDTTNMWTKALIALTFFCSLMALHACTAVGDGDGDGGSSVCGDDRCTGIEDPDNCPRDCDGEGGGEDNNASCGDGQCLGAEDCGTCPADCGACCGDGTCDTDGGEYCGTCPVDCRCGDDQQCDLEAQACSSRCGERQCGEDGFGGSCGTCEGDQVCDAEGACQAVPDTCGDGTCQDTEDCGTCAQDCGACCGDGTCNEAAGENCGTCAQDCACADGTTCDETIRRCIEVCEPACEGKTCGADGCGGSCGTCEDDQACNNQGLCVDICTPNCSGKDCGDDGCGGSCGTCGDEEFCNEGGQCAEGQCEPSCAGKTCGGDGCGGSCGVCAQGTTCTQGQCQQEGGDNNGGNSAPRILTFSSNVLRLTEDEEVILTAVVTDPDGIDDLIGGSLINPDTGATYGAFATAAAEGAYTLRLRWDEMHQVQDIDFTEETPRTFQANFFDQAGNMVTQSITLTLHCDGFGACDSVCTNLTTTTNCGTCGTQCDNFQVCDEGSCQCPSPRLQCADGCIDPGVDEDNCGACNNTCRGDQVCGDGQCQCPEGMLECDGACIDPREDPNNCGTCGNVCPSGSCWRQLGGSCSCNGGDCGFGQACTEYRQSNTLYNICIESTGVYLSDGPSDTEGYVRIETNGNGLLVCGESETIGQLACGELATRGIGNGTLVSVEERDTFDSLYPTVTSLRCGNANGRLSDCDIVEIRTRCTFSDYTYVVCGTGPNQSTPEDNDAACSDNLDNDQDGFFDCDDFDCDGTNACAQDQSCFPTNREVVFGQDLTGFLDSDDGTDGPRSGRYYESWSVNLTANTTYTFTMTGADLDTYLHLYDGQSCASLASDDDGAGGTNSQITFTATTTGRHVVIATTYGAADAGSYTLVVE